MLVQSPRIWLTIAEASALTGLSAYTLRDRIHKNKLEAWTPTPRTTKVPLDALAPFMNPDVRAALPEVLTGPAARSAYYALVATIEQPQPVGV